MRPAESPAIMVWPFRLKATQRGGFPVAARRRIPPDRESQRIGRLSRSTEATVRAWGL
jgi:hypothetical protein